MHELKDSTLKKYITFGNLFILTYLQVESPVAEFPNLIFYGLSFAEPKRRRGNISKCSYVVSV